MRWLHLPGYLLEALSDELPRLEAMTALQRVAEIALGTGSLEQSEQRRILGEWRDEAGEADRAMNPELVRATAAAMGLQVGD